MPTELADHRGSEGVERRDTAIDIEIRLFAGRQCERSGAYGFPEQKGFEVGCGLEHAGKFGV